MSRPDSPSPTPLLSEESDATSYAPGQTQFPAYQSDRPNLSQGSDRSPVSGAGTRRRIRIGETASLTAEDYAYLRWFKQFQRSYQAMSSRHSQQYSSASLEMANSKRLSNGFGSLDGRPRPTQPSRNPDSVYNPNNTYADSDFSPLARVAYVAIQDCYSAAGAFRQAKPPPNCRSFADAYVQHLDATASGMQDLLRKITTFSRGQRYPPQPYPQYPLLNQLDQERRSQWVIETRGRARTELAKLAMKAAGMHPPDLSGLQVE
jgi:hypothetical protein